MGNAAPRMCHEATTTAGRERPKDAVEAAAPAGQYVAAACKQAEEVARPGRRAVEREAGGGGGDATLVTVKVVMTRREAEKLIARLNEQRARERKARMAELRGLLRAGDGGDADANLAPYRDLWTPGLAPIREN